MSSRLGREQRVIFWAVLMTLCSALLLFAAEHPAYYAVMQYNRMLSMVAL